MMKTLTCPLNGKRNINEFIFGGEVKETQQAYTASDKKWTDYLFYSYNGADVATEWWQHAPSGYWFIALRHRLKDTIVKTFTPDEYFSQQRISSETMADTKHK